LSSAAEQAFDELLGSLDYPMFVVTTAAADDGERSGCLVGFTTQCSIHPIRFLVCLSVVNHTARVALRAECLAVHLVPNDRLALSELFGEKTGDTVDKFATVSWTPGPRGVPLLDDCPVRLIGRIVERIPLGDHTGYVLAPESAEGRADDPRAHLRFQDVRGMDPGHPA